MEGFCRGCLIKYDDPMELLHYTEKYRRLFIYSTGLQVKRNDTITFQLCKDCFLNMKAACKFKKLCRSSDKKLKSYLALKDMGEGIDFCTFLKNNDDTMTFRLPLISGSSTPANQKSRDDDNESTTTSIRNFMTDILQGEEVPDAEASIILEVIEEEADVLDDSLDSHWLQDNASIDTDFRLDFSISPFATPHSVINTPKKPTSEQERPRKYFTSISPMRHNVNDFTDFIKNNESEKELVFGRYNTIDRCDIEDQIKKEITSEPSITGNKDNSVRNLDMTNRDSEKITVNEESLNLMMNEKSMNSLDLRSINSEELITNLDLPSLDSGKSLNNLDLQSLPSIDNDSSNLDLPIVNNEVKNDSVNVKNFYIPNDGSKYSTTSMEIEKLIDSKVNSKQEKYKTCSIDKNLEKALQDGTNKEFSLEDLLGTPSAFRDASAASTPTINNILFGEKLNLNEDRNSTKIKLENNDIEGIMDELFESDTKEFYSEGNLEKENLTTNMDIDEVDTTIKDTDNIKYEENQFDLENFLCKLCDKKFFSCKALLIHLNKKHSLKIVKPRPQYKSKTYTCNKCGKSYAHRPSLHKHLKSHNKPEHQVFICDICTVEFTTKSKIAMHMRCHYGFTAARKQGRFLCTVCGASSTTLGNLRLHQKRHSNNFTHKCVECGKGYYRRSDFVVHMRKHTGEKPFHCNYCDKYFARKEFLTRHMKYHIGNKPYKCEYCETKYTNISLLKQHWKVAVKCKKKRILLGIEKAEKTEKNIESVSVVIEELKEEPKDTMENKEKNINIELPYIDTEISN